MNSIYQIYYDEATKAILDPLAIPAYNPMCTDYFENDVMMNIAGRCAFKGDWSGVLSPRFTEKTGHTLAQVFELMQQKPADIYVLCAYDHPTCADFWSRTFLGSIQLKELFNKEGVLPFKIEQKKWVNAYCNFVICRPDIMTEYVETVLMPAKQFIEQTQPARRIAYGTVRHRNADSPIIPYFFEGLWGSFIGNNIYKHEILIKPKPILV